MFAARLGPVAEEHLEDAESDADSDGDVGDVSDEEVAIGEEVGDVAAAEPGSGEEAVDEVADCSTPDESDCDRPCLSLIHI